MNPALETTAMRDWFKGWDAKGPRRWMNVTPWVSLEKKRAPAWKVLQRLPSSNVNSQGIGTSQLKMHLQGRVLQ